MRIVKRIRHDIKMRKLNKKLDEIFDKMKQHESDVDATEWLRWANLGLMYTMAMETEVEKYHSYLSQKRV